MVENVFSELLVYWVDLVAVVPNDVGEDVEACVEVLMDVDSVVVGLVSVAGVVNLVVDVAGFDVVLISISVVVVSISSVSVVSDRFASVVGMGVCVVTGTSGRSFTMESMISVVFESVP